jgi:hypothetical protein
MIINGEPSVKSAEKKVNPTSADTKNFYLSSAENNAEVSNKMGEFYRQARQSSFRYQNDRLDIPCYVGLTERRSDETVDTLKRAIKSESSH